jgi:hypothetical protein
MSNEQRRLLTEASNQRFAGTEKKGVGNMKEQLNEKLTDSENKILDELFIAIYFNNLEKVIEIKRKYPEIYSKKENFKIDDEKSFDLMNLTFFNQSIWEKDDWRDGIMPFVKRNRVKTEKMLEFWRNETGNKNIQRVIEYNQYFEYFYCGDPEDSETVFVYTMTYYLEKGFREIDLKLSNRVVCFDFAETKILLENGAKLDIKFDEDDFYSDTISHISDECSCLASCDIVPSFEMYEKNGKWNDKNITELFRDLIGLAAFEDMNYFLEKYIEK